MYSEQELNRRNKLSRLNDLGIQPYPEKFEITHDLNEAAKLDDGTQDVRVAGRIIALRKMGKLNFISIQDFNGKLQLLLRKDVIGVEAYEQFHSIIDIGDFIGVEGEIFTTKRGEKTLRIHQYTF